MNNKKVPNLKILEAIELNYADQLEKVSQPRELTNNSDSTDKKARFGLGVILCGLLTIVGGLYLPAGDVYSRGFLLFTGIFVIIYGAWVFDKANKTRD